MRRAILLLALSLGNNLALAEDLQNECGERRPQGGTIFTLVISQYLSYEPKVEFTLCSRDVPPERFVVVKRQGSGESKDWKRKRIPLDQAEYKQLFSLYDQALSYDVRVEAMGSDGSTWCIETTRGFTYSKACFWTPSYDSRKRSLTGLVSLGRELWRISGLDPAKLH
jgi:hypothetical protein